MYSPVLDEKVVRTLYRLKRFYRKPMTEIADELMRKSLPAMNKELVCKVCIGERNNDCKDCYLAKEKEKGGLSENSS